MPESPSAGKKKPRLHGKRGFWKLSWTSLLPAATELVLELLNATCSVNEALLTGVNRVGIHGDVTDDHVILDAIDGFLAIRLGSRLSEEILSCGNVPVANRMSFWMDTSFHDYYSFPC